MVRVGLSATDDDDHHHHHHEDSGNVHDATNTHCAFGEKNYCYYTEEGKRHQQEQQHS